MYLTSHNGLLFYYIDLKPHQIIVNLKDEQFPIISVKIGNKNEQLIIFHEFCKCKSNSCSHEKVYFQFHINEKFSITCNGNIKNFSLVKSVKLNLDLPLLVYKEENCACIWLINFQKSYKDTLKVYPNNENLSGCFFHIKFGVDFIPTNFNWSTERCIVQCLPGICNGGDCIETYHLKPICDCNKALLNGEFCNETLYSISNHLNEFQFKILKIAWYSRHGIILKIINGNKFLSIYENENNKVELKFGTNENILTKVISINVTKMSYRILLLELDGTAIFAKLINDKNELSEHKFEINENLINANFTLIDFINGDHLKGDVVYKSGIDDENWKGVKLYLNYTDDIPKTFKGNKNYLYLLLVLLIIAPTIAYLMWRFLIKNNVTHNPLPQNDNYVV